ncbi:isochorismate synthase 2, chloroplastic-like isoform X2 [Ananas comosus]|uniref:isochorismate synthase n=1 Tax=Ananas comosus TaxID=4615 RepID=A0A6P5F2R3_ANACO|nr:isochorismate synthase 2, chloroplastic-like isoform X2 [Ananas comosus]
MAAAAANSAVRRLPFAAASSRRHAGAMYRPCSLSMNGCGGGGGEQAPLAICETRTLPAVSTAESAAAQLGSAVAALNADPPRCRSGIIRVEVPIREGGGEAIEWLQAQRAALLPRCFFSERAAGGHLGSTGADGSASPPFSGNGGSLRRPRRPPVRSVAGVGSAVHFRRSDPFAFRDWRSIKRFLSTDCPLIRAYGAIRFDATAIVSPEWKDYGSFYFVVPQVEFDELEEGSILAMTIAWDDSLLWTWQEAMDELQATMLQISPLFLKLNDPCPKANIISLNHVPTKASWDVSVVKALQMIKESDPELVKVVLARCNRYITDIGIDPIALLACLKGEGQNAYQFCIQPPDAPAFIGNTPEQLFHRKYLSISTEALAGTRARGVTKSEDIQIGQDLLFSPKENIEFTIVRESIRNKLENLCSKILVKPSKSLRKLPRVQHLSAQLSATIRNEDDEFDILKSLHPSPAVCGLPTEEARRFIEENEMFDRGMYAGPVGWFGGAESEFAVGIRSALLGKGCSMLVYAGAGIVEGTNPTSEWKELDLKASQFTRLLQYQEPHIYYQEAKNMGTTAI